MPTTRSAPAQALAEFAIVLPVLVLLVIGGACLFVRGLYRDALDEAAEHAAWAAARSGGDPIAVQQAVARAIPFADPDALTIHVASTGGFHTEVVATVAYQGTAITALPVFNAPLAPATASSTNQAEATYTLDLTGGP